LFVVRSTRGHPDILTSLDFADKPTGRDVLYAFIFGWSELFPLEMHPVSADFSYCCLIDFTVGG